LPRIISSSELLSKYIASGFSGNLVNSEYLKNYSCWVSAENTIGKVLIQLRWATFSIIKSNKREKYIMQYFVEVNIFPEIIPFSQTNLSRMSKFRGLRYLFQYSTRRH
jgi:hypothetical protein